MPMRYGNVVSVLGLFRKNLAGRQGFSLIELLVVVSIISLLAGLLLPSLINARLLAKRTVCAAKFSTLGSAAALYQGDFGEYVPVCLKNWPSSVVRPWKTWRVNLLPYSSGVDAFNCPAAREGLEIIGSVEEMAGMDHVFTINLGSYGVMRYEESDIQGTFVEAMSYSGMMDKVYSMNDCAYPISPGMLWLNPNDSVYIADGCVASGAIEYPTQPPHNGGGTSYIDFPSKKDKYGNENEGPTSTPIARRFADRHKGTNCLFLDGHVAGYVTEDLDTMGEGQRDCVWDLK